MSAELLSWRGRLSDNTAWTQAKFCGKLLIRVIRYISRPFLLLFFFQNFQIFAIFVVNMGPYGD